MKLHDATLDHVPGISGVHVGTVEPSEMARLLTEPNAVLREAGLNVAADAPRSPIVVVPDTGATPSAIIIVPILDGGHITKWVGVIIINGDVIEVLSGPIYEK